MKATIKRVKKEKKKVFEPFYLILEIENMAEAVTLKKYFGKCKDSEPIPYEVFDTIDSEIEKQQ